MNPLPRFAAPDGRQQEFAVLRRDLPMMNLDWRDQGVVLLCAECGNEWQVDQGEPFMAQLRVIVLNHLCAARTTAAEVPSMRSARVNHLRLVDQ
jgi:hypothetical protein